MTYVSSPTTDKKRFLLETEPDAIDGRDGFSEASLKQLVETLGLK